MSTARPPQAWARWAAWGAFLVTIPSAVWRLLMLYGVLPGTTDLRRLHAGEEGYVWGLSIVQVLCGVLALGLVQGWGERVGAIRINRWVPVVVGGLGALAVTWLFTISMTTQILTGHRPDQYTMHGWPLVLMGACYVPILLWGPLLLVAVAGYALRRRR
ncbi:hypothetical protein [Arsenicicoccus sp. oral taxon 190]|uniref:hypothetical protein n=1 Tax=Arsenicicoccus sp. oral taxon 190 TaxID=1658671 RepID=UPI00067A0DF3|nr:hypothetical protein [Arsenicicoccus sp. oral taxon 190]AKT51689.1 hypothetical protein ADJ73_11055 [Arsenicicoccus sp. oral taxon 190]